jgi:hypothetical protein
MDIQEYHFGRTHVALASVSNTAMDRPWLAERLLALREVYIPRSQFTRHVDLLLLLLFDGVIW